MWLRRYTFNMGLDHEEFTKAFFADGPLGRQLSLWITGCCCHKMAKGEKLEPWNWHILVLVL